MHWYKLRLYERRQKARPDPINLRKEKVVKRKKEIYNP